MDPKSTSCLLCENSFDPDELQTLQPGFVLNWKKPEDESKQPIAAVSPNTASWSGRNTNNASIQRPAVNYPAVPVDEPIIRPPQERRRKKKFGDGHTCEYDRFAADGRCVDCLVEHGSCNLLNAQSRCQICHRVAEPCPSEDSKSSFLIGRLLELYKQQANTMSAGPSVTTNPGLRPLKVIVFSQFRASLNNTGHRLLRRFGPACVAEYYGRHRQEELHKFTHDPDCFCLLLTKDGSEGLDLSFTTHMFFFEEIFDKSLERQAVARAWRMGAKGQVQCKTLLAGSSVEETMSEQALNQDENETEPLRSTRELQLQKSLLQSLRFITYHHCFASNSNDDLNHGSAMSTRRMPMLASRKRLLPDSGSSDEALSKKVRFQTM